MSKYTTEVRYICENYAGLDESVGYDNIDTVIENARTKIFDFDYPIFNSEYKPILESKILKHYYTREIGAESVGLWKLWLNNKMNEIMPYYNKLYESELVEYNPLENEDMSSTHSGSHNVQKQSIVNKQDDHTETRDLRTVDDGSSSFDRNEDTTLRHDKTITRGNDSVTRGNDTIAQNNDTNTHVIDSVLDQWKMFSDTPQGGIDGVQLAGGVGTAGTLSDNAYLTNATHITESPAETHDTIEHGTITNTYGNITNTFGDVVESYNKLGDKVDHVDKDGWDKNDNTNTHSGTVRNAGSSSDIGSQTDVGTDGYTKTNRGKTGVITYQEMILTWRKTFINIDMQIIDELKELFITLW